ncbi:MULTISPECIES: hypothetical protein [unclassified Bacillus (in: firmicutes)]|uniref:hypothetical protein n=2 Tax=Bacillus TaxID=1386 RepID=UPI00227F0D70|nr:hypothetical protein [Bacillus sp. N13C7]MCY8639768.1 hypothetical protein [Bacillus sp. S17B2]MCY8721121.1 hypothetical protein [Bacillus sp. S10C12M]MCY9142798.1 hypothetical protein [Bacillus sp. T9C1]
MKSLTILSSFTAVGMSLLGQMLGVLTDSYAVGNAWFAGVLAGLIALLILIESQVMTKNYIVSLSTNFIWGVGFLYFPAAITNIFVSITMDKRKREEGLD